MWREVKCGSSARLGRKIRRGHVLGKAETCARPERRALHWASMRVEPVVRP